MLVDAHDLTDGTVVQAQVCVVGAGAAGITVARTLAEQAGISVCLLEGGGAEPEDESTALYDGDDTGWRLGVSTCRARYLGGTTNRWAGWCHELEAADFDAHAFVERSGWPIDAQVLSPHYARARQTVEIGPNEELDAVAQRVGHARLPLDPERVRTVLYHYSLPPTAFGERYGPELTASDDVTVYLHANAVSLEYDGSAVRRLHGTTLTGIGITVEADHYVLAMGGIENPRFLLANGAPGNASGLLGRCFMEHPHYMGQAYLLAPASMDAGLYSRRWLTRTFDDAHPDGVEVDVRGALALPRARREAEGLVSMAATLFEAELEESLDATGPLAAEQLRGLLRDAPQELRLYGLDVRSEQRPVLDSTITLGDSLDPLGVPRVRAHWAIADDDIDDARRTLMWIGAELGRASIGRLWMPVDTDGGFAPSRIVGGCHHMGATRMSAAPSDGVVDADCRVHGMDNLHVAGSSVFSTGGFANPTLTIVALAHRLGAHLRERL